MVLDRSVPLQPISALITKLEKSLAGQAKAFASQEQHWQLHTYILKIVGTADQRPGITTHGSEAARLGTPADAPHCTHGKGSGYGKGST